MNTPNIEAEDDRALLPGESHLQRVIAIALEGGEPRNKYDRELQEILGTKGKPLYDIQRGKSRNPDRNTLLAICSVLPTHMSFLEQALLDDGYRVVIEPESDAVPGHIDVLNRSDAIIQGRRSILPDHVPVHNASEGETVGIISLDLSLSMGPGTQIEDFVETESVQFDLGIIRAITRSPYHRLRLVKGIGDSMEPTLRTGDRVLVDTTDKSLTRLDGVYWITLYGAHGIKRLKPAGRGRILVISDNRDVSDPMEVDAIDVTIEGRVVWFSREL